MSISDRLKQASAEAKTPNTMDVIMVRVDRATVLSIGEFLNGSGYKGITKTIQRDLKTLYQLNEKHDLYHFPEFEKDKPLTIDCFSATTDKCQAHYIPSDNLVEFQKSVFAEYEQDLGRGLLGTLAHELKHAEQDRPEIYTFAKNKFQKRQIQFLEEAQSYAFERKVMHLAGKGDAEYLAIVQKCTDSIGKVDETQLDSTILERELSTLLTERNSRNSFYREKYDDWFLVLDDTMPSIPHIPQEFNFPKTDTLYQMIQSVPKDPLSNDLCRAKKTYQYLDQKNFDLSFLRCHPEALENIFPERNGDNIRTVSEMAASKIIQRLLAEGFQKKDKNTDWGLLKMILSAKTSDGVMFSDMYFRLCFGSDFWDSETKDKISSEKYLTGLDGQPISPSHLLADISHKKISRSELIEILAKNTETKDTPKKLGDLIIKGENTDTVAQMPVADTYKTALSDDFEIVSKTGYKDGQITEFSRYYNGKRTDSSYNLTPADKEKLTEWITYESWLDPELHGKSWYTRCVYNKRDDSLRTLIYSSEHDGKLGRFLYGTITDSEGNTNRCDAKGRIISPFQQFVSDKLGSLLGH